VNSLHKYEVTIQNDGNIKIISSPFPFLFLIYLLNIEVPFRLIPSTDNRFEFNPSTGRLGIGEMMPIEITFKPDTLGDFNSLFEWSLAVCR
jgi:hypothetical protein